MNKKQVKISFLGGAESVTGSNFLLTDEKVSILVDCGLFQGSKVCNDENRKPFPFDPAKIDFLLVTHAHLDHIGRIPKLVRDGFKGKIYSTHPTKEISELSLIDSLGVMEKESARCGEETFYQEQDVREVVGLWETVDYHQPINVGDFSVVFRDAGHILGSGMVEFTYQGKKILFSGDLGNSPSPLLPDTEKISDINYLIVESVYGDRNHENREERQPRLRSIIKETLSKGGTLMIPAFSIERTQEILFEIENMMENSEIPLVPVYLDSPLAINVTSIYKKYHSYLNKEAKTIMKEGDGLFHFPQLQITKATEQSKAIKYASPRKIIIAGSGMSNGGRILHHEKLYLPDPNSTLLLAGYQAAGSLGRVLQDGAKVVKIHGEDIPVNARVETLSGYSGHKDSDDLLDFVAGSSKSLQQVFVVLGELKSATFLAQRIRDYLGLKSTVPEPGDEVLLEL